MQQYILMFSLFMSTICIAHDTLYCNNMPYQIGEYIQTDKNNVSEFKNIYGQQIWFSFSSCSLIRNTGL